MTQALSSKQENKLVEHLDEQFLELLRNHKKRSEPGALFSHLAKYLEAVQKLLIVILQVPPIDPSTGLRIAYMLRLTNDALGAVGGFVVEDLDSLVDFLDDLDQAWMCVLQNQLWDLIEGVGMDLIVDSEQAGTVKSSPMNQTERARLRSLLLGGSATIHEWLSRAVSERAEQADRVETALENYAYPREFSQLFSQCLSELGGSDSPMNVEPIDVCAL